MGRVQGHGSPPSRPASAGGTYFWIVGAEFINRAELDELLIDAERRKPQGAKRARGPWPWVAPDFKRSEPFSTWVQTKSLAQLNCSKQVSRWEGKCPLT